MKTLIVYDSAYGNTESVAKSIGGALPGEVKVLHVRETGAGKIDDVDLLVVGSPTLGGKASEPISGFLGALSPAALKHVKVAAFDTRLATKLVKIFGYAADRILTSLSRNGGTPAAPPEGFIVKGRKGPLAETELMRAAEWAKKLARPE